MSQNKRAGRRNNKKKSQPVAYAAGGARMSQQPQAAAKAQWKDVKTRRIVARQSETVRTLFRSHNSKKFRAKLRRETPEFCSKFIGF